jgi:TPR repeat protein
LFIDLFSIVPCRVVSASDNPEREPAKAIAPLQRSCADNHAPSCFNLAVLFKKGDTGVPADAKLYEEYKNKTNNLVEVAAGGLNGRRMN